jgi:hypothetical protein
MTEHQASSCQSSEAMNQATSRRTKITSLRGERKGLRMACIVAEADLADAAGGIGPSGYGLIQELRQARPERAGIKPTLR